MAHYIRVNFTDSDRQIARQLLESCPVPRDRLPYTPEYESLYAAFLAKSGRAIDRSVFWRLLSSAAKRGGLARHERPRDGSS